MSDASGSGGLGARTLGAIAGVLFGVVFIWQGASDAFLVLLFALLGLMIGFSVLLVRRLIAGDVDPADIRSLFGDVVRGPGR